MWIYLSAILAFSFVLFLAIIFAKKSGKKEAQLEAIKAELNKIAKEQDKANAINNNVANLSADDARRRLHEVASTQRNNLQ